MFMAATDCYLDPVTVGNEGKVGATLIARTMASRERELLVPLYSNKAGHTKPGK